MVESIPIAYYGESNQVYENCLSARSCAPLRQINADHLGYSLQFFLGRSVLALPATFAALLPRFAIFKSRAYLSLMWNFYRSDWMIPYLFGASPAVCGTFLEGRDHHLQPLGNHSYFLPYATSLRLSDLGYQSDAQASVHLSLNSLDEYTTSLVKATTETYPPYRRSEHR